MRSFVPWRQRARANPFHDYQVAALRLQLLVAMAAADGKVQAVEVDRVAQGVDSAQLDVDGTQRLDQLMRILVDSPPSIEQVIEHIVAQAPRRHVAEALVGELIHVAGADDHLDDREEALLRMICGALKLEPSSLHAGSRRDLDAAEQAQLEQLLAAVAP